MWNLYYSVTRSINHFDSKDWTIALVCVVTFGIFCMRGFGSRDGY